MKKFFIVFLAFSALGFTEIIHAKSRSSLRRLKKIRVGKSKTVRGYDTVVMDQSESKGDVHIIEIEDNKHEITGTDDGIVVLKFYDEDGQLVEEKAIDIKDRAPEPRVNVGFGFGFRPYGYYPYGYRSGPNYSPYWGWGHNSYYNHYW